MTAFKLKQIGVKSGVPDICLPVARGGCHGLYIEMKRRNEGKATDNQKTWIAALREEGYAAGVCRGMEDAKRVILAYLEREKTQVACI